MPAPRKGESQKDYLKRAIPYLLNEGTAKSPEQAAAIAHSMYRGRNKNRRKGKDRRMLAMSRPASDFIFCLDKSDSEVYRTPQPLEFWKEIAHVGQFEKDDFRFSISENLLDHWDRTFRAMNKHGLKVPLPVEHTRNPEAKRGDILDMRRDVNSKGQPSLFARIKFRDQEAAKLKDSNVSIFVPHEVKSGYGQVFVKPIEHVAITDYPVIHDLEPFQPIVCSLAGTKLAEPPAKTPALALDRSEGFDPLRSPIVMDAERRFRGDSMALSFPDKGDGDKPPDKPNVPDSQPKQQGQPTNNPQAAQQMTLRDLASQLGIDPSITDEQQLLQAVSAAIAAMKARAQAPMPPRPGMPPGAPQAPAPGFTPMMPHAPPSPAGYGPPAMHTGRPPIAMTRPKNRPFVALSLEDLPEEVVMSLSKKQMKKVIKAIKKGKSAKGGVSGDKDPVQHLNEESHFGQEDIGGSDEDDTFKDEDNDAFYNGCDNDEENEETMSGKGKPGLSRGMALSGSLLTVVQTGRQVQIDDLHRRGFITSHAKKDLEARFIKAPAVAFSHEYDDGFEATLNLIRSNGRVLPAGRTGPQTEHGIEMPEGAVALSNGGRSNPVVADAERRAAGKNNFN